MSPHEKLKNKVKKMLQSGKSQSAIAEQLSLSRHLVHQLRQSIIQDKINWNKKKSDLEAQSYFILDCLQQNMPVRHIHSGICQKDLQLSYSTVAKFVAYLKKKQAASSPIPGQEAKVFFLNAGFFLKNGKKVRIWIFLMKFTYSQYCWYYPVTDASFESFLECHTKAFVFFKGMPRSIKISHTKAFNLNHPNLRQRYANFLAKSGTVLTPKSNRSCCINCPSEGRRFNEYFRFHVFHHDYSRFCRELVRWYSSEVNLGVHPATKIVIKKEFLLHEKPNLLRVRPYSFTIKRLP
jgi:hypothetical protein